MIARPAALVLLATLALPAPASAQTRILVVPDGAPVVVPPRGQAAPTGAQPSSRPLRRRLAMDDAVPLGPDNVAEPALSPLVALLPLAAAAALAATLPGSGGGGGSGPVRTR